MNNTLICPHWIPTTSGQYGGKTDKQWLAEWNPPYVKIVFGGDTVPRLDDIPREAKVILRSHPISEDGPRNESRAMSNINDWQEKMYKSRYKAPVDVPWDIETRSVETTQSPKEYAIRHITNYRKIIDWCVANGLERSRIAAIELLNEPNIWSTEPPNWHAQYTIEALIEAHKYDIPVEWGVFGVGWPGVGDNNRVDWNPWNIVIPYLKPYDFLGLHEYWALNGVDQNWSWWAGRYEQCPFDVPILITETGIDTGVVGQFYGGYLDLPGSEQEKANRYIGELAYYEKKCASDGRIKAIFPFTMDGYGWSKFNIRNETMMKKIVEHAKSNPVIVEQPNTLFTKLSNGLEIVDMRGKLTRHISDTYMVRDISTIKRLIIHHTTGNSSTTWSGIARYNVDSQDYPGIVYHFGVEPNGRVVYLGDINTIRYHAGMANSDSVGIACLGDYEANEPTEAMIDSLMTLCKLLVNYFGRTIDIVSHSQVSDTLCPGKNIIKQFAPEVIETIDIINEAWKKVKIPYNKDSAFARFANERNLGVPMTEEFDVGKWRVQGFALGIIFAEIDKWDAITLMKW